MPSNPSASARCGAKTRKGTPCKRQAGWGTQHGPSDGKPGYGRCRLHGGAEPHAQVNGMVALARAEQLMGPLSIEPQDAILQCIAISAGEVAYASEQIAALQASELVGEPRRSMVRKTADGTVQEVRADPPALHVWVMVRQRAMDRLVAYSFAALKAGIEERRVTVSEQQGVMLAGAIQGILRELGVDQRPEVGAIVRRQLTLVAGQPAA